MSYGKLLVIWREEREQVSYLDKSMMEESVLC